jgi:hypothetical protein
MRPDGASMLTMLYEGEPGWSGPPDPHRRPGRSDRGQVPLAPHHLEAWPADDEQLRAARDNSGKRMASWTTLLYR